MDEKTFNSLIKKNKYQVFLLSSPCSLPISFVKHIWIVTNNHGKIKRWDAWSYKSRYTKEKGFLTINYYSAWLGLTIIPSLSKNMNLRRYKSKLVKLIEGGKGSLPNRIIRFIENNYLKYPYKNEYHYFPGPNSNTFMQWILNHFPESKLKLPWNALGKGYNR